MKPLYYSIALTSLVVSCGTSNPSGTTSADLMARVNESVAEIRVWATTCKAYSGLVYPAKDPTGQPGDCGDGDSTEINGNICLSGASQAACEAVRLSVGADGRLWRSPFRVGLEGVDTSSRDQLGGFLSYLVRTKDKDSANRFYGYLQNHDYMLCPTESDNRCELVLSNYGQMARVWRYIGLSPSLKMILGEAGLETSLLISAQVNDIGYTLNDTVEAVLRLQKMGENTDDLQRAADDAFARQPNNPFFAYVSTGASDQTATIFLDTAPTSNPAVHDAYSTATNAPGVDSMGWEYIALAAFMEGK